MADDDVENTDPAMDPAAGADAPAAGADDAGAQGTVLCTVMSNGDGTYTLVAGDESDAGADVDDANGAGGVPGETGAEATDQPGGQQFDGPGPLLKAILDLVKADQSKSGGSEDDNLEQGYKDTTASM